MVSLVALQLESLDVPGVDEGWHLRIRVVRVEATNASEQLTLLVTILPLAELPVLTVDKDSNDALPTRLCEVRHAIIDIERN